METDTSNPGSRDEEHAMNFTVDENDDDSVDYFDQEMVLVPSANLTPRAVEEVDVELNTGCESSEEKDLKEIEELMNIVKGSLSGGGGPHRNLIAIAKEALKTAIAQSRMATQKDRILSSPESGST